MRRTAQKGQSLVEFTLIGIPMIFVLISIFEIARITWLYNTVASATAETARCAIVHGRNCNIAPNTCALSVADLAARFQARAIGLKPADTTVSFTSPGGTVTCRLDQCSGNTTVWPPSPNNDIGMQVQVSAAYATRSPLSMLWPGAGRISGFQLNLTANSPEAIQF